MHESEGLGHNNGGGQSEAEEDEDGYEARPPIEGAEEECGGIARDQER
jgi:hypothetical protein